ncbi:hypothetical protein GCM10027446_00580 [Angustibacter peucedani]
MILGGRRRAAAVVVLAALLGLTACSDGSGTTSDGGRATASARETLEPRCPALPPHPPLSVTVDQLNEIVGALSLPHWQAADIGASARLQDGRIVWVFGDTLRSDRVTPRVVANSMLVTSGLCTAQVLPPGDGPVIPDREDGVVHWPMSVAVLEREGQELVVVTSARIRRGPSGAFDFTYLGSSATTFVVPPGGVPQRISQLDITADNADPHQVNWGSAMVVDGDWLYVYGTRLPSGDAAFGRSLAVARAPVGDPRDRSRWRFWDGARWTSDLQAVQPVLAAQGGVSQTLSVNVLDGSYVVVSKRDGDLGHTVYSWTAPSAVGPWTARRGVTARFQDSAGRLQYAPLAHPDIHLASGKLLVSISRNTTDFARLVRDPSLGRPVFAEIDRP